MNYRLPILSLVTAVSFYSLNCTSKQQGAQTTTTPAATTEAGIVSIPRGIAGLEVGMTPQELARLFEVKEDQDPVAALLEKYGKPNEAEVTSRQNETIQKRFFRVSSGVGKLPNDVTSADARTTHDIAYEIGLHYDEATVKRIGWEAITYAYIAKYGKPSQDTGSGLIWEDVRTRLDIEASGSMVNVFFVDKALEIEVKKDERSTR